MVRAPYTCSFSLLTEIDNDAGFRDKRLESWVKDSGFLGTASSKPGGPTIVTPKQYKTRFRDAMEAYFLLAPDPWLHKTSLMPLCGQPHSAAAGVSTGELFVGHPDGHPDDNNASSEKTGVANGAVAPTGGLSIIPEL
ncbi:hypothetical protein T439DRAFT_188476 [Meredithblackwellia eburnea MCA 4105]